MLKKIVKLKEVYQPKDTIFIHWMTNYILNTRTKLRSDDQTPKVQQRSTKHQTELLVLAQRSLQWIQQIKLRVQSSSNIKYCQF